MDLMTTVLNNVVKYTNIGAGLWLLYGVFILAMGLKDKTGPQIQSGIWQIVGGGLILATSTLVMTLIA